MKKIYPIEFENKGEIESRVSSFYDKLSFVDFVIENVFL